MGGRRDARAAGSINGWALCWARRGRWRGAGAGYGDCVWATRERLLRVASVLAPRPICFISSIDEYKGVLLVQTTDPKATPWAISHADLFDPFASHVGKTNRRQLEHTDIANTLATREARHELLKAEARIALARSFTQHSPSVTVYVVTCDGETPLFAAPKSTSETMTLAPYSHSVVTTDKDKTTSGAAVLGTVLDGSVHMFVTAPKFVDRRASFPYWLARPTA